MTALASLPADAGAEDARRRLADPAIEAVEIAAAPLDAQPFRDLVQALKRAPGFRLDFRGQTPDEALALVARQLFAGAFAAERASLAAEIERLAALAAALVEGARPQIALRTYFAPGDLVWHVDRVAERRAFRLLWPLGRPGGMRVTQADNIDPGIYGAYMRREHPLLCRLDTEVLRTGAPLETLWAHRPAQLAAMTTGRFPFIVDPARAWSVAPGAISIHRVATPAAQGTFHCSSWANRHAPGVQIVITVAADPA
ncbi:hypothetical protein E2493_14065 [Sphingomonas parva]|uniref:Uncharacterized protein n=1 Tax=Sphingomonas parva TaxID=2555898 RepID=A0A4Y8ZRA2_9SPHN|nr:hypothetical protein [Sphingomonas parva]TFI57645.1 hypothetical protein E2493_14065 [Sphingomonas parva]